MEFGWINVFNGIIVVLMIIPNIIFHKKVSDNAGSDPNIIIKISENIGRYASMFLMVIPLLVWSFGFRSPQAFECYLILNIVLLAVYYYTWFTFAKKQTFRRALVLALAPSFIFLFTGLLLHHWLLVISASIFMLSHLLITYQSFRYLE